MKSYREALDIILNTFKPKRECIHIPLEEALYFTLAEDIVSDIDSPPFDNSAMDGIAILYEKGQKEWQIAGNITAGNYAQMDLNSSYAAGITTGSKIPEKADTIIPLESLNISQGKAVLKEGIEIHKGDHIRSKGSDFSKGKILLHKGTRIATNMMHLLAACGKKRVAVYKPLKIGLLLTGDELVDIDSIPERDQIRATNHYSTFSQIKSMNMQAISFGIAKDNYEELKKNLKQALDSDIDALIACGGASVGEKDFMQDALKEMGAEILFGKANIKPGKPIIYAIYRKINKEISIFGLPGNPLSSFVNFEIFIKPAIALMYGIKLSAIKAYLKRPFQKKDNKRYFALGELSYDSQGNRWEVGFSQSLSSGSMFPLSQANCLAVIPENINSLNQEDLVECMPI
ncbi:MAG: molybdopterin molybdotransferase MoeA [Candidatus Brocadiae bacterium]|nr:molybdopterin molybdotransferase MoeA [Candidatus Brocadiia bacterium]